MDSIKCEAFLLAADHGSLTAAAEILGYTQPGITRMIRSLEEELGFTILTRSKRGVVPTENGIALIPNLREMVRAAKNAEEMGSEIKGMLQGVLSIGSYYSVSSRILPPILKEFGIKYPNVHIKLREGGNLEMAQWLNERSVDFCFAAKPSDEVQCDWIPLFKDEHIVWVPKDHKRVKDGVFPIEALDGEPFIVTMPNQDTDIDRLFAKYNVHPDIRFSTADAYTTYCMVEAGLGIGMNQRLIFEKWDGDVVALSFKPKQYVELGISLPSYKDASPAARKFIELIKKNCFKMQDF